MDLFSLVKLQMLETFLVLMLIETIFIFTGTFFALHLEEQGKVDVTR
jgi:hypothetical protein